LSNYVLAGGWIVMIILAEEAMVQTYIVGWSDTPGTGCLLPLWLFIIDIDISHGAENWHLSLRSKFLPYFHNSQAHIHMRGPRKKLIPL
jgi:hypothetical protein